MNIILLGPPGAGKGTQGDNLAKNLKLFKVSSGDLLRKEIKNETLLGKKIKSLIDDGLLVSDDLINNLIEKILSNKNFFSNLIFDGYPRNLDQARNLDYLLKKHNQKITFVLSLNVNENIIIKRILGRQVCSKCGLIFNKFFNPPQKEKYECLLKHLKTRSDDNEKTIKNRFNTYSKNTLPILNYYHKQGLLYKLDGMREIHEIYKEIRGIISSLES